MLRILPTGPVYVTMTSCVGMAVSATLTPTGSLPSPSPSNRNKPYDYLLKFLLVGDSDVGKEEILSGLDDGAAESPFGFSNGNGEDMHP